MISESRIINSKRNIISGVIKQILGILLPFVIRTLVIMYLGSAYQGISGLFTSILNMLSLAEMGFSTAVVYSLYKPIAENDLNKTSILVNYLKKVYKIIGFIILVLGLFLIPFLPYLIKSDIPADVNIYVIYLIYLTNTAISYLLFAYRSAVFIAMQKENVVNNIANFVSIGIRLLQIIIIVFVKNFYVFTLVIPLGTLINNLVVELYARKQMPKFDVKDGLDDETKKNLKKQIKALFISKLADTARNSFDVVVISAYIGLNSVTIYDNYLYILTAVRGFLLVLVSAMQASVGNSLVKESIEKNYKDFKTFTFSFMLIAGVCTTCLCTMYQPFMKLWMNNDETMILSGSCVILFGLYFYILSMDNSVNLYFHGNGYYHECRWWYVIEALSNLLLNLILCKFFGIVGILVATVTSLLLFNFLPRTYIVYKYYFKMKIVKFLITHIVFAVVTGLSLVVSIFVCSFFTFGNIPTLFIRFGFSISISCIIYLVCFFKTIDFKNTVTYAKKVFKMR